MSERNPITQKIIDLLKKVRKGEHILSQGEIVDLYEEFADNERAFGNNPSTRQIIRAFSQFFGKNGNWAHHYHLLRHLHPELRKVLGKEGGISVYTALNIVDSGKVDQLQAFAQAKKISHPRAVTIDNVSSHHKKRKFVACTPPSTPFPTQAPAFQQVQTEVVSSRVHTMENTKSQPPAPQAIENDDGPKETFTLPSWRETWHNRKSEPGKIKQPMTWKGDTTVHRARKKPYDEDE